jgi:tripartite-type tricarboxylate transporter receptor subunit TctC
MAYGMANSQPREWPQRPIKLVVPVAPGGVYDSQARIIAERLGAALGQPVIVENKPGAESKLGTAAVANAAPDGYTILMCGSSLVLGLVFSREPQYKLSQFTPLAMCCWLPIGFGISAAVPADTLQEFVKLASRKSSNFSYGSIAVSTRGIGESFKLAAGIDLTHVAYKGESPLTTDLVAGHVHSGFMTSGGFKPWYGKNGRVKWLAVTTPQRMTRFPDVPTFVEVGYPQIDMSAWLGFVVPSGTPPEIADRLSAVLAETLQSQEVKNRILDLGVEPHYLPAAAFSTFIAAELGKWTRIQKDAGIEVT